MKLNSSIVKEFLNDVRQNTIVEVLEEGKELSDLIQVAKKRGIDLRNNVDLGGLKLIYAPSDKFNKNRVRLPAEIYFNSLSTLIGKPIDIDHQRKYVVGNYIDIKREGNNGIAYVIIYRSNFEDEWKKMQDLFRKGKLSHSFEIHSPKNKRKYYDDGTFDLMEMVLAGGAILFREKPAFPESLVLEMAKRNLEQCNGLCSDLVYSSEEIITSDLGTEDLDDEEALDKLLDGAIPKEVQTCVKKKASQLKKENKKVNVIQIVKDCWKEYKKTQKADVTEEKTENKEVTIKQIKYEALSVSCPSCSGNKWEILKSEKDISTVRCGSCLKKYEIEFGENKSIMDVIPFNADNSMGRTMLLINSMDKLNCPQCQRKDGQIILDFKDSVISAKCCHCSLNYEIALKKKRTIKKIKEIQKIEGAITMAEMDREDGLNIYDLDLVNRMVDGISCPKCEEKNKIAKEKGEEKIVSTTFRIVGIDFENKKAILRCDTCKTKYSVNLILKSKVEKADIDVIVLDVENMDELEKVLIAEAEGELEEAARLTYEQRKALPDSSFAVVVKVKDKRTGKLRKIRMFPIHDEAHVRNALARLGQPAPQVTLKRLGVSLESVKKKILKRAKQLKMTTLLERYEKGGEKMVDKVKKGKEDDPKPKDAKPEPEAKPEDDKPKVEDPKPKVEDPKPKPEVTPKDDKPKVDKPKPEDNKPKVEDPKPKPTPEPEKPKPEPPKKTLKEVVEERTKEVANLTAQVKALTKALEDNKIDTKKIKADASKVATRKSELGTYAENISDKDLLNDAIYENLKLKKEKDELEAKNIALKKTIEEAGLSEDPSGHIDGDEEFNLGKVVDIRAEQIE